MTSSNLGEVNSSDNIIRLFAIALAVILTALIFLMWHPALVTSSVKETVAYILAAIFGASVGAAELISRYRDKPASALATYPSAIYMIVNSLASLVAFWLLFTHRLDVDVQVFGSHRAINDLMLGGFGAMALFRTSVFNIKIGDNSVGVGPAAVLQVILRVTDRETDRLRAGPRAAQIGEIMRGVVYERARDALPLHCFALMQNLTLDEQNSLEQALSVLDRKQTMGDEAKAYSLGLLLINLVGEDVLSRAVVGLGDRIKGPPPDSPPVLSRSKDLDPSDIPSIIETCRALSQSSNIPTDSDGSLIATPAGVSLPSDQVVIVLARLRKRFGQETLSEAINTLIEGRTRKSPGLPDLTDLTGQPRPAPSLNPEDKPPHEPPSTADDKPAQEPASTTDDKPPQGPPSTADDKPPQEPASSPDDKPPQTPPLNPGDQPPQGSPEGNLA